MNYKTQQHTPIKITIEGGFRPDKGIQLTLSPDADINDWIEAFKTILIHQTFSEIAIKELFEEADYTEPDYNKPDYTESYEF